MMNNREQYCAAMGSIRFSDEHKTALIAALSQASPSPARRRSPSRLLLVAAVVCALAIIGAAAYGASQGSIGRLAGQHRQEAVSDPSGEAAATYNGHTILMSTVRYQQKMNILRTEEDAAKWDTDREAVDRIVESIILLEEAERRGLSATEEEIASMVQSARSSYELPAGKAFLDEYCAGAGITIEEYFALVEEQAPSTIARQKLKDAVGREYCETHGLEYTKNFPPEEMLEAVDDYIEELFEARKADIVYYID